MVAGSEGVPVPKRTKMVKPEYPAEAQAKGLRGIVILDLTIDAEGKVAAVDLVRSIPGLDEAAVAAVKKWEYEPVKIGGRPVPVKLTVPITFLMQLPEIQRQAGIPELRQGATPAFPKGAESVTSAKAEAELSVDADGRVLEAAVRTGEPPFSESLLQAIQTWVFAADPARGIVSFSVQVEFTGGERRRIALNLSGLRQSDTQSSGSAESGRLEPAAQPAATPAPSASAGAPAEAPSGAASAPASEQAAGPAPARPREPAAAATATAAPGPPATQPSSPAPQPSPAEASPPAPPSSPPAGASPAPAAPPTEVLRAPVAPAEAQASLEAGVSAVRDVVLGPGVPELVRGRRPVPPPFARMAGVTGTVHVRFSIDASGGTLIQGSEGPELLRPAAEQAVATWLFRRTSTERLRASGEIAFRDDGALTSVRLER